MTNFYFNLTEKLQGCSKQKGMVVCTSNPDGQPTVNRQSAMTLLSGKKAEKEQLSSTCLRSASDLPPFRSRYLRYAAMIFCVLALSIGQMWGAETVLFSSFANSTASNYFKSYTVDGKTVTVAASSTTISSSSGDYFCSMMGSTPSNNNGNYVELSVTGATIKTVSVLITGNGENKTCQPALLGWEGAIASNTTADYVLVPASQVISNKGVANAKWHQFDVHGNDLTRVRIYRAVKGVDIAGESTNKTTYGNGQTLQFYGIRVELEVDGVTKPTFSPATGSSLVKSDGTVALTSSGNTVYYKWSQTNNQYTSGDGATLAGAADDSGTSPVNATAPSTTGTWYLYAVAKNGSDYSDVVKATYTITPPTHTLTWNLDGGTATGGTAAGAVAEGATLTAPTVKKDGYDFAGWSPTVPATMPADDATYTAAWTKVYASGTYQFDGHLTVGTSPSYTVSTTTSDYAAKRADNIFFSATNIQFEGTDGTPQGDGDNYKGWKVKASTTIKFFVEDDSDVEVSIGSIGGGTCTITYTDQSSVAHNNTAISAGSHLTYKVKAGTMVTISMAPSSGKSITLKRIAISGTSSCTAPSSVSVAPTNANGWRYSLGETIDLTCTAEGGTGTKTYQWQKYIGSTWTDINTATNASAGTARLQIANCTSSDGGSYRCVVSTGATCSLASDGYWVRVFTLNGAYYGGSDTENAIVWTDANTGVATVHLNASSTYMFKVTDNDGRWFGYGENNYIIQPVALDCGTENQKLRLLTGPEGDYTFTINVQHAADVSPYVNIATGYPTVSHPNSGYAYITKWWDCYIHYWEGTNNALTAWGSDPKINSDRYVNICGTDYWYFPVIDTYNKFIAKNNTGDATDSNTTGNQETTGHGGQYITHSGSWGWHEFSTYTISFANGGGTGTMSAITGICPNSNQAITANAFEKTGHTFNCWHADKAVKVGGNTIAIGGDIAGGATLQEINNNITLTAQWSPEQYDITLEKGSADAAPAGNSGSAKVLYNGTELTNITHATWTGHVLTGYYTSNSGGTKVLNADGSFAATDVSGYITDGKWIKAENTTLKAQWTAKTTTITIDANTANHGSTAPSPITATYGSALPSFTAATGASGYSLTGYFTAATDGTKIINADGTLVRNTTYSTDESTPKWNSESASLTLYPQYEEEAEACYEFTPATSGSAPSKGDVINGTGSGGTMVAGTGQSYTANGLKFESSGDYRYVTVTLDNNLKEGSVIAVTMWMDGTSSNRGLYLQTSAGTQKAEWKFTADSENHQYSYTVEAGDGLINTNVFRLARINNVYLKTVTVSNCGDAVCTTPTTAFADGAYTVGGSALDLSTLISGKQGSGAITYTVKNANGTGATIAGSNFTATSAGTATVTATQAADGDYCEKVMDATITVSAAPAGQTALVINTLYEVPDMIPSGATLTDDDQFFEGLSANTKFELIGSASSSTTPKANSKSANDKTIDDITFDDGSMWFKGTASLTSNVPTTFGLSFIVPEGGGKLYLYFSGTSTNIKLAKSGEAGSKPSCPNGYGEVDVTAGTYYLYGTGETSPYCFYGLKLCSTYSVSITTTNTTKVTGDATAVQGKAYTATFTANTGYTLPSDVTVSIGGAAQTKGTGYTWTVSSGTGTLTVPAAKVTGDIVVTVTGTAAATYALNYECNGAESGCPSNTTASALPNPLPSAPTKDGYTFGGWFTDEDLTVAAVAGAAMTGATTLYAKWTEDECTPTTLFSMVVSTSASNYTLAAGTTINQSDEAISSRLTSISGGGISITNNSGSSNKTVFASTALSLQNSDVQCAITLTGALQEGDVITVTTTNSAKPYLTSTDSRSNEVTWSTSSYTHSVTLANTSNATGKNLIGKSTFYLWYGGSAVYIRSLTVTRPCDESAETCKTPNITNIASTTNMTTAETKSLNVTVSNTTALTGTVSYAWTNADGSAIAAAANASGANTARLTLTEPAAGTYTFKCTVTNDCGGGDSQSATSAVFTVVVTESTGCTEIAKVIVSSASAGTGSGTKIAETGGYGVNLENTKTTHDGKDGYKLGSSKYVYLQLASGEQFQNGDKVKVYITNLSDQGDHKLHIFQGTTAAGTEVATVNSPALGWNEATLSNVTTSNRSLTIHRSSGTTEQNHGIYAFAVERCVDCTPATHEGLAYTKTSYTVGETAEALTVTNPENVDTYQWKWNTTNDRTGGTICGTNAASFIPPTTSDVAGTRYYWCELTNDCGTVKTSAVGITVSADLSDVTVTWTNPAGTVNYGGGGYTIKATVGPAAWDGTLDASMLTAPEGIRIYDVTTGTDGESKQYIQATFDVQTTFDREANATDIPFALTLAATATYDGKIDEHNVAYDACAAGGGGGVLFSQNFNSATEVAYTNGTETAITTSSGNNIVGNTAASQFTYIGIVNKSSTGIAINTASGGNSQDITGAFQAYANNTSGKYALVKTTNFAASAPTALRIEADVWFKTKSSATDYSLSFAVGEGFSNGTGGASASNVHSGFSFYNASTVYLYAYKDKNTKISGTNQFTQSSFQKVTWVINNTGADLEYTNPAGTKSTLANDKFDVWVGTKQFVSGQAATTPAKALQNLYIGDPNGKSHEFRLDNVVVTDISTSSGTGSLTTALTWNNSQADGVTLAKNEGTADFAVTAVRDAAATTSLGTLTYSSSDPSVATVNATTGQVHIADNIDFGGATYKETIITATLTASGCYKRAEITYVLRVNKRACDDVAGTVTSTSDGCTITLTLSGYTTGATIQWYKDGVSLGSAAGAQTATYTATESGEYYAVTSKNCDRTSNTVTIASAAVSATKIVDEWYVKNGRRTPDIALVQTENATDFTVTSGGSPITSIGGCGFYLGTDGIIYLKGAKNDGSAPSGMTEGDDVLSITATGCSDAAPVSVTIHRQEETDKYVLAYVVTGKQDGGWTQDLPPEQTTGVELYRTLNNHFDLQATNIYATTDEQKIKEYYSRYDIIFITDYPNTKTTNKTTKKSYVNALGAMIDIRPILTMEAWVSGLSNWSAKGVAGNPKSPTTRQYNMLLQCKDHEIFSGTTVETIGEGDDVKFKINMVDSTQALYDTLDTKYGAGTHKEKEGYCYGKHPALQGFVYDEALADMLPLGLIDDGAGNDLQVGLERQKEMEARMMVLGINADAMERLSEDGETVIVNALKYLMKKDAEDISDCSIYFDNAGGNNLWSNVANWGPSHLTLPQPTQEARIMASCIVDGEATAASIKIISGGKYNHGSTDANGSLTIAKSGILKVGGRIVAASAPNYYEVRPTDATKLIIQADGDQTGALIHGHKSGELNATVQLVSKAYSERETVDGKIKTKKYWQYVGLPVQEALAEDAFYGGYTYKYEESAGWTKKRTGDMLEEFWGIGLSYDNYVLGKTSPITFTISGALALATNRDIELTKTAEVGEGENMIGNSWTAPIHLVNMTDEDFENATATIYLFNTGRNDSHTNSANGSTTAGQWVSVPVAASKLEPWVGPKVIPAMQAFEVDVAGGATSGTLHLNYDKHVRAIATPTDENAPLRAPKRYMDEEPMMLRLRVADSATYTDLYLIEGEQLSDEFDNGWDGKYQQCDGRSATLYALSPIGNMAVLAQQSINNTAIVFRPGRQNEYTFTFGYNGEVAYYLNDLLLEQSTEIREGNEYRFTCNEGDMESRFVVSTTPFGAPDIATGIGNAGHPEKVQKIMYKDHIYIIRGGRIYDVVGKMVK